MGETNPLGMGSELLQSPPPPPPTKTLTVSMKTENTYHYRQSNSILGNLTYRCGYMYKNAYCSLGFVYSFFGFGFYSNNFGNIMKVLQLWNSWLHGNTSTLQNIIHLLKMICIHPLTWTNDYYVYLGGKKRKWQRNVNMNDQTFIKNEWGPDQNDWSGFKEWWEGQLGHSWSFTVTTYQNLQRYVKV